MRAASAALAVLMVLGSIACDNNTPEKDPHVQRGGGDIPENPAVLSPPIVEQPLYACGTAVVVKGFVPGARIDVFVDGAPTPVASGTSNANWGQSFAVPALTQGQVVTATQTLGATTSGPSDPVTVRSHTVDYPNGIPTPRIDPTPLYACGRATGVRDVVPGAQLTVHSEKAVGAGFDPPADVGKVNGSGAAQAVGVNPPFEERARITADYAICSDRSAPSAPQIVRPELVPLPPPTLDPVYEHATTVVVRSVTNGAVVDVFANAARVGGQASSGGAQAVGIAPPAVANQTFTASQQLCAPGTTGPPTVVQPCSALPPAKIRTPMVGDTRVDVTEFVQGSRIVIRVNNQEIGDGGGPVVQLTRPLLLGEQVVVVQWLGKCQSQWIYVVETMCVSPGTVGDPSAVASTDFQVGSDDYSLPAIPIGVDSVRLDATVRYPADTAGAKVALATSGKPFPLVVFLHGNHGTVRSGGEDECGGNGTEVPSHAGYNYVLESLARGGMIAISINANDLNCKDDRIPERAELILAHLREWKRWADAGQPDPQFGGRFHGGVDLKRIGLAGHSRGGEAVVMAPSKNSDPDLIMRAVLSIAPVDAHRVTLGDLPLLVLLPSADGDVRDNSGARIYDRARGRGDWFKSQMYVYGASHNFFNSQWLKDDGVGPDRTTRAQQEVMLRAWARGFFDLHLKAKPQLLPIFSGDAVVGGLANERVFPSYELGNALTVDDMEQLPKDVTRNTLQGSVTSNGFGTFDEFPFRRVGSAFNNTFFHDTSGLVAGWRGAGAAASSAVPAARKDVSAWRYVSVRVAAVLAADNDPSVPVRFAIGLEDNAGSRSDVPTQSVGRIPFPYAHPTHPKSMMRTLRIPFACFRTAKGAVAVDDVKALHFSFNDPAKGVVGLDQIQFSR